MNQLATIGLPLSGTDWIGQLGDIARGIYTEIVEIVAPSSAPAGSTVSVTIKIKNNYSASVYVAAIGVYDSELRFIDWLSYWIPAGATQSFSGSFIMPGRNVIITAYSYYYGVDGAWHYDDAKSKDVKLVVAWQKLAALSATITPEVVAWQKLATVTTTITPVVVAWQKLATASVTLTPVAWQKLATKAITITPEAVIWQKLTTKAVTITPEAVIPPGYKTIQETIYPYAYIYDGPAETCVYSLKLPPEQFTPPGWIGGPIANAFASQIKEQGERVLELRVYADTTPTFWTDYRIEVTSTVPAGGTSGIAFPWAAVIVLVLAILLIVVITWAIDKIYTLLFKPKPLSEEIKKTWSRGTLIGAINDFEVKLGRTPTPTEELEMMSDQELRDYCDEMAEEIVPVPELLPLAILGVIGVLGVGGVAVAYAMAKPEEK